MFHDFCQSVTLVFCQRTHVSHDHHPRGPCCSRARISYDEPRMGAISYQKIFASALTPSGSYGSLHAHACPTDHEALGPTLASLSSLASLGGLSGQADRPETTPP